MIKIGDIEIVIVGKVEEAEEFVNKGYTPVECSFGNESVVNELEMDHHGSMSDKESVAIRAYRDLFGACAENKKFVVNHIDADNMFAICALCGILPHPKSEYAASLPPHLQKTWLTDLTPLAETIATMDTDPIGRDILSMPYGKHLVMWNALYGNQAKTPLEALAGVQAWVNITTNKNAEVFLEAARASEQARIDMAKADLNERSEKIDDVLLVRESRLFGFDVWYGRNPEKGKPTDVAGWENPVVVSWTEAQKNITIATPNEAVAEKMFGKGGLINVFNRLDKMFKCPKGQGFGGREVIGGSPRGQIMTKKDAEMIAHFVNVVFKDVRLERITQAKMQMMSNPYKR